MLLPAFLKSTKSVLQYIVRTFSMPGQRRKEINLDNATVKGEARPRKRARLRRTRNENTSPLIRFVMRYSGGLVKNSKQARMVVLGIVILLFLFAVFLLTYDAISVPGSQGPVENSGYTNT